VASPPFTPDDWTLFVQSRAVKQLHFSRRPYGDDCSDGHAGRPGECQECAILALRMVSSANRTFLGRERGPALSEVATHSGLAVFWLKDALRAERAAEGRCSRPAAVAQGKLVSAALAEAHSAGRLDCDVETAQTLLELVIYAVGDETSTLELGYVLPYGYLSSKLENSSVEGAAASPQRVACWCEQIFQALEAGPMTARILGRHVFAHSDVLARHIAAPVVTDEGDIIDPIEDAVPLGHSPSDDHARLLDRLVEATVARLVALGVDDPANATAAARRALADVLGADVAHLAEGVELAEQVAAAGRELAARYLAENQARAKLALAPGATVEEARELLREAFAERPGALPAAYRRNAGRDAYEEFLTRRARRLMVEP